MKYYLHINDDAVALSKGICYIDLSQYEIEITEEQFNQINEFPLKLTIKDGKVVAWEKIEIEHEPVVEPVLPTIEDRIFALEEAINFLLGM